MVLGGLTWLSVKIWWNLETCNFSAIFHVFDFFKPKANPKNKRMLVFLFQTMCWGMVIFAAMAILVNCVFLLVVISWAMWVAPRRFHLKSFRMRWKFMIQKMRPSVYWWMMTIFFKAGKWVLGTKNWICYNLLELWKGIYIFEHATTTWLVKTKVSKEAMAAFPWKHKHLIQDTRGTNVLKRYINSFGNSKQEKHILKCLSKRKNMLFMYNRKSSQDSAK